MFNDVMGDVMFRSPLQADGQNQPQDSTPDGTFYYCADQSLGAVFIPKLVGLTDDDEDLLPNCEDHFVFVSRETLTRLKEWLASVADDRLKFRQTRQTVLYGSVLLSM